MAFNISTTLMDALVLSVVNSQSTYGYKITQDVRSVIEVSESTLYPVLRRLQKSEYLMTYDQEFAGRNRRYYSITDKGKRQLAEYRAQWTNYAARVNELLFTGLGETKH